MTSPNHIDLLDLDDDAAADAAVDAAWAEIRRGRPPPLEFRGGPWTSSKHPRGRGGKFARTLQDSGRALINAEAKVMMKRLGFTFGGHVTVEHDDDEGRQPHLRKGVIQALKAVFGGKVPNRRELARIVGAPDGAHISLTSDKYKLATKDITKLRAMFFHPSFQQTERILTYDSISGRRTLDNSLMYLNKASIEPEGGFTHEEILKGYRAASLGTRLFATQVREARKQGISRINVHAVSNDMPARTGERMNGAYTWARLGYNAYIPRDHLPDPTTVPSAVRIRQGDNPR
jgi:hypothetical protein